MRLLSTRDLADALGVSESSLKRWIDAGKIAASRTEGGHRRVEIAEAMRFIRTTHAPVARPELLDLPEVNVARASTRDLASYLFEGDDTAARGWLVARYLEGQTIAQLADGPIRAAMTQLGDLWNHDEAGIFIEHRATDICLRGVAQLRAMMPDPDHDAPIALGAGPPGDPYLIPSQLAAMVLMESGLRAINLGPETPTAALAKAITHHRPKLVWLSISVALTPARSRALTRWISELPTSLAVAVGGQQMMTLRDVPPRVRRVFAMSELAEVGLGVVKRAA
ncbi:MAG: helix-turn-helix domain-containing protein [Myxococcales bacterium]|nr:helix-turn-helix domain-containing protein [Myxococcales bacterium]